MQDWAAAFDAPVHLHAADRDWVVRPDPAIRFWDGDALELAPGVTLVRLGGHFAGGTVLHWAEGADGDGVLLAGDILQVTPGRGPGLVHVELSQHAAAARRRGPPASRRGSRPGATPDLRRLRRQDVLADAEAIVARSAARYIALLEDRPLGLAAPRRMFYLCSHDSAFTQRPRDDQLQPGPDRIDGADLDVDEAAREREGAHHVLGQRGRKLRRRFGQDTQIMPAGASRARSPRELGLQHRTLAGEDMDQVERPRRIAERRKARPHLAQREVREGRERGRLGRQRDQQRPLAGAVAELGEERPAGISRLSHRVRSR